MLRAVTSRSWAKSGEPWDPGRGVDRQYGKEATRGCLLIESAALSSLDRALGSREDARPSWMDQTDQEMHYFGDDEEDGEDDGDTAAARWWRAPCMLDGRMRRHDYENAVRDYPSDRRDFGSWWFEALRGSATRPRM